MSDYNSNPGMFANAAANNVPTLKRDNAPAIRKYEAIVAENKVHSDGAYIRVYLTELLPLAKGHIKDNPIPMTKKWYDARGTAHTSRGTHNNNITCKYYTTDTYRKTPPDVQRGERVMVWQQGDTDQWWWEPTGLDSMSVRRTETVIHSVAAETPEGKNPDSHDASNTYYQEMSSQNKTFTISTSKKNGEVAAYAIQINAGGGCIVIEDDQGNYIHLDTKNTLIDLKNKFGTQVSLDKNNIEVNAVEQYNEKVGGNKTVTIKGNCKVEISGNAEIKVGGSTKLECANTEVTGNVKIGGDTEVAGSLKVSGSSSLGGGGSVTGSLSVSGPVNLNGGTSNGVIKGSYIDT